MVSNQISTNSFLFSSLNMEIVYSILWGINKVVRDLDPAKEQKDLTMEDFEDVKQINLNSIRVLKKEFFEETKVNKLTKF